MARRSAGPTTSGVSSKARARTRPGDIASRERRPRARRELARALQFFLSRTSESLSLRIWKCWQWPGDTTGIDGGTLAGASPVCRGDGCHADRTGFSRRCVEAFAAPRGGRSLTSSFGGLRASAPDNAKLVPGATSTRSARSHGASVVNTIPAIDRRHFLFDHHLDHAHAPPLACPGSGLMRCVRGRPCRAR